MEACLEYHGVSFLFTFNIHHAHKRRAPRVQHLHTSAGPRWWFLAYRHRVLLDTLVGALRRRLAPAPL